MVCVHTYKFKACGIVETATEFPECRLGDSDVTVSVGAREGCVQDGVEEPGERRAQQRVQHRDPAQVAADLLQRDQHLRERREWTPWSGSK